MRYIVVCGVPGAVDGANTVEDLTRYLATNPQPRYRLANMSWLQNGNILLVWETDGKLERDRTILVDAVKKAIRKHDHDDQNIGWGELSDTLNTTLSEVLGDQAYNEWVEKVSPEKTA